LSSSKIISTTCPLDCFDSCSVEIDENLKLKGEKSHPVTQGYLCQHLSNFHKFSRIEKATLYAKEISIDRALEIVKQKMQKKTLYYKGSGNLGVMQGVTKLAFRDATVAQGSLCEDAGAHGIEEGRGANLVWSPLHVAKSDVVVIWGRNPSITNSHMLPALRGKTLIVIDPYRIDLVKKADLHVSVKPRGDIYLALLLARAALMDEMQDEEFIESRCENFDYYMDLINSKPIIQLQKRSGVCLIEIYKILELIKGKKVSFLVGLGVQKYSFGHSVLRAIDSFVAMLGLFGKEGCGVSYIADSSFGFAKPFHIEAKSVEMPIVDFGDYDFVFIQGGNPANQMPCTPKVIDGLKKAKFVVYFGLHVNETSMLADLVIPAKTFLEKEDLKLSYGQEYIGVMPKIVHSEIGISEYELCQKLGAQLRSEKEYIDEIRHSNMSKRDGWTISKTYENIPYEKEFYTASGKFEFFDDFEDDFGDEDLNRGFYLLSAKSKKSLNSQFKTDQYLYVPTSLGLKDEQNIVLSSGDYECKYIVKNDKNLRDDCMLLYSGHKDANMLTPHAMSEEGECAIFQELKCVIKYPKMFEKDG